MLWRIYARLRENDKSGRESLDGMSTYRLARLVLRLKCRGTESGANRGFQ
jgi:hypothetical protein